MMSVAAYCKKYNLILLALAVLSAVLILCFRYSPHRLDSRDESEEELGDTVYPIARYHSKQDFAVNDVIHSSQISKKGLPQDVIDGVEKFVFFVGYPRSGHSIVGSFMDAHPHMVIAHEFMLFSKFRKLSIENEISDIALLQNKSYLFNSLYRSSALDSKTGWRSGQVQVKNYTLTLDSPWLGRYDGYISVIGDKSGGKTANMYSESPEGFIAQYEQLQKTIEIPIKVIHCIRNPYDMVATNILYMMGHELRDSFRFVSSFKSKMRTLEGKEFMDARFNNETLLERGLDVIEGESKAVMKIIKLVGADNVLELHNSELVNDPKSVLQRICAFLGVECSEEYLQACSGKVFKTVSKSRNLIVWQDRLLNRLENLIGMFPHFYGYTFDSE